jgi:WD40 repeat protein
MWNVANGAELRRFRVGGNPIDRITFSPDGKQLAAVERGQVQVWDAFTGETKQRILMHSGVSTVLELSARSHLLISGFDDAPWCLRTAIPASFIRSSP